MIKIIILRADKGKIYTNGKIEGTIVWVDESEVNQWYQISIKSKNKKETPYEKFKYDLNTENIEE